MKNRQVETCRFFWWIRGESVSPAGSVRVGSDCPRQSFTPDPFDSLHSYTKSKSTRKGCFLIWWIRGESNPCPKILSRSFLRAYSVRVSPSPSPDRQRSGEAALLSVAAIRATHRARSLLIDAPYRAAVLSGERAA